MSKKLEINYSLCYTARDDDTRETAKDITMSFENPSQDDLIDNLNTWLKAVKAPLEVVVKG